MNTKFKVKLTLKDDKAVYNQNLPRPIHLKIDAFVELALIYKYGTIGVLLFFKYAYPIFATTKPNGKLRLPVDFRKNNRLIADDYINNNHRVSALTNAAQQLGTEVSFLQTRLLPSVSVFANSQPTVSGNN